MYGILTPIFYPTSRLSLPRAAIGAVLRVSKIGVLESHVVAITQHTAISAKERQETYLNISTSGSPQNTYTPRENGSVIT